MPRYARCHAVLLLGLLTFLPALALGVPPEGDDPMSGPEADDAESTEDDGEIEPFGANALHLGGGVEFSYSQASIDGTDADAVTAFTLEGEVGYFIIDGLKLSGVPFFSVTNQDDATSLAVGAALGVGYYFDLDVIALFGRARGGVLFGTLEGGSGSDTSVGGTNQVTNGLATAAELGVAADLGSAGGTDGELKGFVYGGGIGVALPVRSSVIELAVEYLGSNLSVDASTGTVDANQNALFVRLGYLIVL